MITEKDIRPGALLVWNRGEYRGILSIIDTCDPKNHRFGAFDADDDNYYWRVPPFNFDVVDDHEFTNLLLQQKSISDAFVNALRKHRPELLE